MSVNSYLHLFLVICRPEKMFFSQQFDIYYSDIKIEFRQIEQEIPSKKSAHGCNNAINRRGSSLQFHLYYHLILSSKQRNVNEGSHAQREAYVNVTSPDVLYLSEPELHLAPSHILPVSI